MAKAEAKVKKLRVTFGDYDASEMEHSKVLRTVYSFIKRLLKLLGPDLAKSFLSYT